MTLTLEDLMEFMKQEKLDRQKEREADKAAIKELIMKGVQEEVEAAIKPLQERQAKIEEEQVIIQKQYSNILQELKEVKERAGPVVEFPELQPTGKSRIAPRGSTKYSSLESSIQENLDRSIDTETKEKRKLAAEARKIIGIHRIIKEDIERVSRIVGAKDEDEAYLEGVKEFFKQELRMDQEVFDSLGVKTIFPPAKDNWDTLYVVFHSETAINTIFSYAKNLKVYPQRIL